MGAPFKPPAAPRRRDQALAFIIERIARSGISPTLEEIAVELRVSKPRARQLVDQLVDAGLIERTAGAQRALRVRNMVECQSLLHAALRRLGWVEAEPMGELSPFPNVQLPPFPPFDHLPDVD